VSLFAARIDDSAPGVMRSAWMKQARTALSGLFSLSLGCPILVQGCVVPELQQKGEGNAVVLEIRKCLRLRQEASAADLRKHI
jgi:hypothetical protein